MRYYLIAGEASGDLHGAALIRALSAQDPQAEFRAWGGDAMQAAGAEVVKHYRDLAIMGVVQVLKNLWTIRRNFKFCYQELQTYRPDVLILIDYSGFNLRVARRAKSMGLRVFYYISPQVWATRAGRVRRIRATVERMYCILPFERDFYQKYDYEVEYVGHPLLDVVGEHRTNADFRAQIGLEEDAPIVALLPGSRRQEIRSMLPLMLSVVPHFPECRFVVAGAAALDRAFYEPFLKPYPQALWIQNQTYDLLAHSRAALVTSGTATLETALWRVPQAVCYRAGALLYHIVKRIIKIHYLSLVNIILNRPAVRELLQHDLTTDNLRTELNELLEEKGEKRRRILADYDELRGLLGRRGAAERAARSMVAALKKTLPEGKNAD